MFLEASQIYYGRAIQTYEQREWMNDPWSQIPPNDTLGNVSIINGTRRRRAGIIDPNTVIKRVRTSIIRGDDVEINVIGLSGGGKSQILEGFNDLLDRDLHLAEEMRRRGLTLVRRTLPFSMGIKAAQIPKEKGGPGVIPLVDDQGRPITHGAFRNEEYAKASKFIGEASEKLSLNDPTMRLVKFREAPGLPYITKRTVPVGIEGMADRGNSPIYNSAYRSNRAGKYIFIVVRQENVGESARALRQDFDPDGDMSKVFNSGIDYVATNREGSLENIAGQPEDIQRDVVRLLGSATASDPAIGRSNREYYDMVAELQDRGVIPDTDALSYAIALRNRLMWSSGRAGLPGEQIYLVLNPYSKGLREGGNKYNLDYFLKDNYWALTYRDKLVPPSLCERYLPSEV